MRPVKNLFRAILCVTIASCGTAVSCSDDSVKDTAQPEDQTPGDLPEDNTCDKSQKPENATACECVDGNWDNCTFNEEKDCDESQKPEGAITCECVDGNWENCTFSEDSDCDESQKPEGAISCECIEGNWENCTFSEDSDCDESQKPEGAVSCECIEGNWDNCIFSEDNVCDESQKPENAITCECVDGNWENCIFTEDNDCDESQKPDNVITCECIDGSWANCTYPEGDICADSNCAPGTTCDPEDGQCKPNPEPPKTCDEANKPQNAITCKCVDGSWTDCTFPEDKKCDEAKKPANAIQCDCIEGNWKNCIIDTTETRLLSENIVYNYYLDEKGLQPAKHLMLTDFSAKGYESKASKEYTKNGQKTLKWAYTTASLTFPVPRNLSDYDALSFDVYVPEKSVGQTFFMYFQSENSKTDGSDYYGKKIKFAKSGWNTFDFKISDFSTARTPLGWNHINKLVFTSTGWDQTNDTSTVIYLGGIKMRATKGGPNNRYKLVDFSSNDYKANASTKYTKNGSKSFEWKYSTSKLTLKVPKDLRQYHAISFWVYVPKEAVGQTFFMYFGSENNNSDGIDYYGRKIELKKEGWNRFTGLLNQFSVNRSPLGWNRIDNLVLTSTGWNQTNSTSTVIYLDDIFLYKKNIPYLTGAAFSLNGARSIVDNKLINNGYDDDTARVFKKDKDYWLPLTVLGARYDSKSTYHVTKHILEMTLNGKKYQFEGGKNSVTIDGKPTSLGFTPVAVGNALFAPKSYIKQLMGYTKEYTDGMEWVYLSTSGQSFKDLTTRLDIMYEMLFMRPTSTEAVAQMYNHLGGDVHPRVMMTQSRFNELRNLLKTDETLKSYYNYLVNKYGPNSAEFKDKPVVYSLPDGKRLLSISRKAKDRIIPWAMLYKLTDNEQYAARIWDEVNALINFKDWHPDHYLDTAEILYPMAIAYDWLYDKWQPEQRKKMEIAVRDFGLKTGLDRYEGRVGHWGNNNWTGVCNGGLTSAAIAYANSGQAAESAQNVLNYSIQDYEAGMYSYAPDGGYLESPGYWSYGTDYMHVLISSLDSATGSTQGIYYSPGFAKSAYFTTYFENEAGSWGFHDSGSGQTDTNCQAWFARKSGDKSLGKIRQNAITSNLKKPHVYDVMWYAPGQIGDSVNLALDAHYSQVGSTTMRSSWNKNAILVGLHGGANNASHGDLDIGNFILYAAGKRILMDLGSDNYNLPNYFGNKREQYYKKRAEGQNTLVIGNVSYTTPDQVKNTVGEFIRNEFDAKSAISIVDMSTAYTTVDSGSRGVWFKDNRSTVVLQDEIKLKSEQIVRWAVHAQTATWHDDSGQYLNKCVKKDTAGEIKISKDGRSATITRTGTNQHLYAEIVSSDTSLKFTKELARSYDKNYPMYSKYPERPSYQVNLEGHNTQYEHCRIGIEKLAIITPKKVKSFNVAVVFKMINNDASDPAIGKTYKWTDMAKWTVK